MFDRLHELFNYDQETGLLTNKVRRGSRALIGAEAGCLGPDGYRCIRVDGTLYRTHRIIWMLVHGYFPENDIDHINGVRNDNRLANLRETSRVCNMQNKMQLRSNTSGFKGVSLIKATGKWRAKVEFKGKCIHIGVFKTKLEAAAARRAWEESCPGWVCNSRKEGTL